MSTKQTVIFSFMVVFLGVMFFALGSYFYWSIELESKRQQYNVLTAKTEELTLALNGTSTHPGLAKQVEDPEIGLKSKCEAAQNKAKTMEGNEQQGAIQREQYYEAEKKKVEDKWTGAKDKWKKLYEDWSENNKKIAAALGRLNKDRKDKDEKVAATEQELEQELKNEETTRNKAVAEHKDMEKDLSLMRSQSEEVADRVETVTRETQADTKVARQGEIIFVAMDLKKVTINLGSMDGLRKGLLFNVYSKSHSQLFKKASIEITEVRPTSADGTILPPKHDILYDSITGWVAPDPRMRYSVFAAAGPDETDALELVKPKTRADRIEDYRLTKEFGAEKAEEIRTEKAAPTAPPFQVGAAFAPIVEGDWIHSPDFVPLLPDALYQKRAVAELLTMENVSTGSATFYFTDNVPVYRQEFLKRMCERNQCKVADQMCNDVNFVVTPPGTIHFQVLQKELEPYKDKGDEVPQEIKKLRKTFQALVEARKIGADVLADDSVESFFEQRHRKMDLLRGKTIQPGQHIFFIAGETKILSAANLKKYITDCGGVVANDLNDKVEYIVTGSGLDKKFFEETVKGKGLKVIREDELPRFFGLE